MQSGSLGFGLSDNDSYRAIKTVLRNTDNNNNPISNTNNGEAIEKISFVRDLISYYKPNLSAMNADHISKLISKLRHLIIKEKANFEDYIKDFEVLVNTAKQFIEKFNLSQIVRIYDGIFGLDLNEDSRMLTEFIVDLAKVLNVMNIEVNSQNKKNIFFIRLCLIKWGHLIKDNAWKDLEKKFDNCVAPTLEEEQLAVNSERLKNEKPELMSPDSNHSNAIYSRYFLYPKTSIYTPMSTQITSGHEVAFYDQPYGEHKEIIIDPDTGKKKMKTTRYKNVRTIHATQLIQDNYLVTNYGPTIYYQPIANNNFSEEPLVDFSHIQSMYYQDQSQDKTSGTSHRI